MAAPSSLYRFRIELSDIPRGVYRELDFRIAQHPSESTDYLLTRVLAIALNETEEDRLDVAPGLCADDQPALSLREPNGGYRLWIEIGNPSARRLHKASKASRSVRVYTYKDAENLLREATREKVHRLEAIEIFSLAPSFLKQLAPRLERDNRWGLIHDDGELTVSVGAESVLGALTPHPH